MGLQISSLTTDYGFTISNVYVKVLNVSVSKINCHFLLGYFNSKTDADAGKAFIKTYANSFDNPDIEENIWVQIYTYVKTLPEFIDATDL